MSWPEKYHIAVRSAFQTENHNTKWNDYKVEPGTVETHQHPGGRDAAKVGHGVVPHPRPEGAVEVGRDARVVVVEPPARVLCHVLGAVDVVVAVIVHVKGAEFTVVVVDHAVSPVAWPAWEWILG